MFAETYAEAGADVALVVARNGDVCRDAALEISRQYGVKTIGILMDVRDSERVGAVLDEVVSEFGRLDILVNNAGVSGTQKPVIELTDADIDAVLNVDFKGFLSTSRAAARHMVRSGAGRIINIASILGQIAARNMVGYCASKAAVIYLTRVMALELIHANVQVNALCPKLK